MFRNLTKIAACRASLLATSTTRTTTMVYRSRELSTGFTALKPKKKQAGGKRNSRAADKHAAEEEEEELVVEDPRKVLGPFEEVFGKVMESFKEKANLIKQGTANERIFDKINVQINSHESQPFTAVAQTATKGRNLIITVFDPLNVKHVISSILAAELNLTPEVMPSNAQQLKVPLPSPTVELKREMVKEIKQLLEHYKNSSGKLSLSTGRNNAIKELKKFKKNDEIKKVTAEVEKAHKKYVEELTKQFQVIEKSILN